MSDIKKYEAQTISTISDATPQAKAVALNAKNDAVSLAEHVDEALHIVDVIMAPGIRKSRVAGVEDVECMNTYLIDNTGQAYVSQSDGVARSVASIVDVFPDCNKPAGLIMQCKEKTIANGNTVKTVSVAIPS